jgi:hypothetical protein
MMQMLAAGGMPVLTDDKRVPDESNPRGYFEFEPVKRLRTDRSWVDQACGYAVKIIHLLLRELPNDPRFDYRVILMRRPMEEVLASQRVMLERDGKKTADAAILAKAFQTQMSQIEQWLAQQEQFKVLPIDYPELVDHASAIAMKINEFLGRDLDIAAMAHSVDPALYRQRSAGASSKID